MDPASLLAELTRVAVGLGIEVRSQALRGTHASAGGLCRMAGRTLVLLSARASQLERCAVLAAALAELGHVAHPDLGLEGRALVERRGRPGNTPKPRTPLAARPGLAGLGGNGRRRH